MVKKNKNKRLVETSKTSVFAQLQAYLFSCMTLVAVLLMLGLVTSAVCENKKSKQDEDDDTEQEDTGDQGDEEEDEEEEEPLAKQLAEAIEKYLLKQPYTKLLVKDTKWFHGKAFKKLAADAYTLPIDWSGFKFRIRGGADIKELDPKNIKPAQIRITTVPRDLTELKKSTDKVFEREHFSKEQQKSLYKGWKPEHFNGMDSIDIADEDKKFEAYKAVSMAQRHGRKHFGEGKNIADGVWKASMGKKLFTSQMSLPRISNMERNEINRSDEFASHYGVILSVNYMKKKVIKASDDVCIIFLGIKHRPRSGKVKFIKYKKIETGSKSSSGTPKKSSKGKAKPGKKVKKD